MNLRLVYARYMFLLFSAIISIPAYGNDLTKLRSESCRKFVQGFYDWYTPIANSEDLSEQASDIAIKERTFAFTSELLKALREDSKAMKEANGEIVGLDFDPFLNSQDPRGNYVLGNVFINLDRCQVEIFGISEESKKGVKPDVIPELILKGKQWRFVNFLYEEDTVASRNLLTMLKSLSDERGSRLH